MMNNKPRIKVKQVTDFNPIEFPENTEFIVFLDFDGVLHGFKGGKMFTCLERFENILRDYPKVKVVFATSWRFNQTFDMLTSYFSHDLQDRFVGINPYLQEKWPPYIKRERYHECIRFMEDRNYTGPWLAIDDAKDLYTCLDHPTLENFVCTDGQIGIDDENETKIRNLLKKTFS